MNPDWSTRSAQVSISDSLQIGASMSNGESTKRDAGTMKIAVMGTGYVGATTAACLAHLNHRLVGVDVRPEQVDALNAGTLPFVEPGLDSLLNEGLESGRLQFTTDPAEALAGAQAVFICVGTPLLPT